MQYIFLKSIQRQFEKHSDTFLTIALFFYENPKTSSEYLFSKPWTFCRTLHLSLF